MLIIAFHIFILAAEPHFQQSGPLSIKHMKVQTFAGNQIAHLGSSTPSTPSSPHPNLFFQGHPPVSLWQSLKVVFWEKEHDFFPITWRGWGMPLIIHSFFDRTNIYSVPPPFTPKPCPLLGTGDGAVVGTTNSGSTEGSEGDPRQPGRVGCYEENKEGGIGRKGLQ